MSQKIFINVMSNEVRVALLEEGMLQEIYIEKNSQQSLTGNIYKGKVIRLLPGLQAAFIDIGLERAGFLHISDLLEDKNANTSIDIREKLMVGQELLVQVYKNPLGSKGARLTMRYTIPARFLVLTPNVFEIAVSQKIIEEAERERLIKSITTGEYGGYIFRTAAEGVSESNFISDQKFLDSIWKETQKKMIQAKVGTLIYEELPIFLRVLRDFAIQNVEIIQVDHIETVHKMVQFATQYRPDLSKRIQFYSSEKPIFDQFSIEDELQKALQRKVYLKSGAYLVFDQTEAMTTIDINTGSYVGHANSEQSIFKVNLEAVEVIARQIRLRNLGGIIIIDFIDMEDLLHKEHLLQALTTALKNDTARTEISEVSRLGLVQMTRKRTRESLENILCVTCPACQGRGSIKSLHTLSNEIFRELKRISLCYSWPAYTIVASQEVIHYLSNDKSKRWDELAKHLGKPVNFRAESSYMQEQYHILPNED